MPCEHGNNLFPDLSRFFPHMKTFGFREKYHSIFEWFFLGFASFGAWALPTSTQWLTAQRATILLAKIV